VNKISDEHELGGGLIFRWRLWPLNVACLEFKGGNAMMDSGMDANVSPHPFWSNVVLDIFPRKWSGLHVFGPFAAKLPDPTGPKGSTRAQDVFCTHIPIFTPVDPDNTFKDVVEIEERYANGTIATVHKEPNVWGFTMIYLNWSEMKKRSDIYQRFEDVSLEFELFKKDEPRLGSVGPKGAPTAEMTRLAWSERGLELNDENSLTVTTESLHGIWVNQVGDPNGWDPTWWPTAVACTVIAAFLLAVLTAMTMAKSYMHKDLVKRMLPKQAIRKLQRGQTVVEKYNIVTVFFADIVGYTGAAGSMRPTQVMKMLNELYTELDKLAEKHQVYKVETVGNQYMVVAGAPNRVAGRVGAQRVGLFALDAINFVSKYQTKEGDKILIRAGISSGPTVAGVVGKAMPRYCFFGETVDFASKMESTSKKMKIQVSEMTYRLLNDCINLKFVMTKRMEGGIAGVEIKGKGQQVTYWIEKAGPCEKCFELATGSFALVPCGHIMCAECNEKYRMLPCPTCRCKVDDRVEWRGKPTKIVDESIEVEHAPIDEEAGLKSEEML
jgi:class 3 adenylate cyclase